jgi:PAS domain S-box-containing protein
MRLARPTVALDRTYLFLAFVGFLYLLIGLFTVSRERAGPARIFWALCLSSFAVYVVTPAGPHDAVWKAFLLTEDFYRALLPALLLHFFLVFPRPLSIQRRRILPFLYLPGAAYLAVQEAPLFAAGAVAPALLEFATRLWQIYFADFGAAALWRLAKLLRRRREDAEAEKQMRWIGLGVAVGLAPFLLLSVFPRILGLASPLLSSVAVVPLVFIPLAFAYAILKWRLWDVEIFVREALATTAAVLLGGMTFVLLNTLLDRTFEGMAEAGKNVIAFGSGLVLAALLVPVKKRITGVLERIQYPDTFRRAARRSISRETSRPARPGGPLGRDRAAREDGSTSCRRSSSSRAGARPARRTGLLGPSRRRKDVWRPRGAAFRPGDEPAAERLHAAGYRVFRPALRGHSRGRARRRTQGWACSPLLGGRVAVDGGHGPGRPRLRECPTLRGPGRAAGGDPNPQQYQESVIRSSSSGILVIDRDGRLQSANPAFAAIVGRPEAELVGSTFAQVLPDVDLPPAPEEGSESAVEARFWNARGEERDLRVSVSAFRGEPDRRVVLVDDVTDRVRRSASAERSASLPPRRPRRGSRTRSIRRSRASPPTRSSCWPRRRPEIPTTRS